MEIQEILRVAGERWRVIASAMLLGVSLALAWTLAGPVDYQAQARVMIATYGSLGSAMDAYNGERISQLRAPTYAQILRGPEVARRAATALGGRFTPEMIERSLDARISAAMPMVVVTAKARTPDDAARIVTMVEQVFEEYVKEIEQPGRDGSRTAVRLTGDPPEVTRVNNPITTAVLAAIAGLVSGIAIALYRDRTDEVLRSPGQLARVGLTYRGIATIGDNGRQNSQEGFRKLAVECLMSDDRGGTRLMVSGVGAEAPTFDVAHGLAVGFASYGRATVLLDTGTDEDSSRPGLSDFLAGLAPWQACTELPQAGSVATVSAGSQRGRLDELLIRANRNGLELPVDADGQMVVVAPSILASPVGAALSGFVDACLLVATLHVSLLSDLVEAALTLEALECRLVGIVVVSEDGQRAVRKAGRESVPTDLAPATVASSEP